MKKIFIILSLFYLSLFAQNIDYEKYVKDIEGRFAKALIAYDKGDFQSAKQGFQLAYFEVFENLEGPIRINVSAKKSYTMEAQFGDLRKMVVKRAPKEEIKASADSLIKEMYEILPELQTHTIVAEVSEEEQTATKQEEKKESKKEPKEFIFDENWEHALVYIQNDFEKALDAYEPENSKKSREYIRDAQFAGYRNTQLEIAIRKEISIKKEAEIQVLFPELIKFIHTKPSKEALGAKLHESLVILAGVSKGLKAYSQKQPKKTKTKAKDFTQTVEQIKQKFQEAFKLADNGEQKKAISLIQDTYFDVFEGSGMEGAIGAKNANLKTKLEGYFSKTIGAIKNNSKDTREKVFKDFALDLQDALKILSPEESTPWSLFLYSLTIILREGLEALLIVTAIIAYLVKSGNKDKMGIVYSSLSVAVILSFATAWVMNVIFGAAAGQNRELLEGITMLVAAGLLFYVSYWLLSNAQAKKWNNFINENIKESLSSGSVKALWFTVFLAVYREGAETVLFYQALISEATTSTSMTYLIGGFILGLILLLIIYFVLKFTALKIPIKPFFLITGIFIYIMCFMFVGQGVAELIEGKVFIPTLVEGIPTISSLGIYPYMQSLIPQAVVLAFGVVGVLFITRKKQI